VAAPQDVVIAAVAVGAAVGLDNMQASAAIGVVVPRAAQRRWLVALVLSDAVALVIGAAIGAVIPAAVTGAAAVVGVVVLIALAGLALAERADDTGDTRFADTRLMARVPILLGFDNLAAGAALVAIGYPAAPTVAIAGTVAALMCLAGFVAGATINCALRARVHQVGGVLLSVAAVLAALELGS
jgi:putative Mn2+ efflux pump MntP